MPSANLDFSLQLKCPFTMMVSGPSNCGKSTFVKNLLLRKGELYNIRPGKVIWYYRLYQNLYDQMLQLGVVDEFVEGMPTMDDLTDKLSDEHNSTIIIDDMAMEATADTSNIFTVGSHHLNMNVIFICQNIFTRNPHFRQISTNNTYTVLFKNVRDKTQIVNFAKQYAPGQTKQFVKIYYDATKEPHTYLMLDYHQETPDEHRIRSNFLREHDTPIRLFQMT